MPRTPDDVKKLAKESGAKIVDLRFIDLPGMWQHFSIPVEDLDEDLFTEGIGFDGSSIRGFQQIHESDMLLIADAETAVMDPVLSIPTMNIICNVFDPLTRKPYSRDPRYVAQKAEAYLKSTGLADISYWGPEAEFYMFDSVRYDQNAQSGYYYIDSREGVWNTGREENPNLGYKLRHKEGYFPVPPSDQLQDIRSEILLALKDVGVKVEVHHHEVGTAGQAEIDMRFGPLVKMADNLLTYKYVIRMICKKHGMTATFMPKPLFGDNGSGMHVHQSLWKGDTNVFYDRQGLRAAQPDREVLHRRPAQARAGVCSPSAPRPPTPTAAWCPATKLRSTWATRSATARRRCASRCTPPAPRPSASSSAAPILPPTRISASRPCSWPAWTESSTRSIPASRWTRISTNSSRRKPAKIKSTPGSLGEVLDALEKDHAFLLEGGVFTPDLIETWITYKRTRELAPVNLRPVPYEFFLYYDL